MMSYLVSFATYIRQARSNAFGEVFSSGAGGQSLVTFLLYDWYFRIHWYLIVVGPKPLNRL